MTDRNATYRNIGLGYVRAPYRAAERVDVEPGTEFASPSHPDGCCALVWRGHVSTRCTRERRRGALCCWNHRRREDRAKAWKEGE